MKIPTIRLSGSELESIVIYMEVSDNACMPVELQTKQIDSSNCNLEVHVCTSAKVSLDAACCQLNNFNVSR